MFEFVEHGEHGQRALLQNACGGESSMHRLF